MRRYAKYKDSSVKWIGDIPEGWGLSKINLYFKIERGRVISKEEIIDNIGEYPVFSSQTENLGILGFIKTYDFEGEYVSWTTDGANAGTCFHRIGKFSTTNVCGLLSNKSQTNNNLKFLALFLNLGTKAYVRLDINPKLMNNMMGNIPFILPPLIEQEQIVAYLDEKTSHIDKLLDISKRKIGLLKEQRASIINQVVTKGLNPNAKMKHSGVEWIGYVPEGWGCVKMKYMAQICNGSDFKEHTLEDGGFPVYGSGGIFSRSSKYLYNETSVLLGRKGSVDKPKIVFEPFWCSDTTYFTKIYKNVIPVFFYFLVQQIKFDLYIYGSTIPSMTKSVYDEMVFPLPSLKEQEQIVAYLDEKTSTIDKSISIEERRIGLLKEYRQSIISQVVTGKIKVTADE